MATRNVLLPLGRLRRPRWSAVVVFSRLVTLLSSLLLLLSRLQRLCPLVTSCQPNHENQKLPKQQTNKLLRLVTTKETLLSRTKPLSGCLVVSTCCLLPKCFALHAASCPTVIPSSIAARPVLFTYNDVFTLPCSCPNSKSCPGPVQRLLRVLGELHRFTRLLHLPLPSPPPPLSPNPDVSLPRYASSLCSQNMTVDQYDLQ